MSSARASLGAGQERSTAEVGEMKAGAAKGAQLAALVLMTCASLTGCGGPPEPDPCLKVMRGTPEEMREAGCDEETVKLVAEHGKALASADRFRAWAEAHDNALGSDEAEAVQEVTEVAVESYLNSAAFDPWDDRPKASCFVNIKTRWSTGPGGLRAGELILSTYKWYEGRETTNCAHIVYGIGGWGKRQSQRVLATD
ncbi:hypothetical protein [Streptomyces albidoflavus]|uniref:hypothetical protein n=1 Tax=Streptomyces albidoflavus TaxID=1886 RepID=UPI00344C2AF0